ncbi:hypothetical protein TNCT_94511 [Trichonephila clavata]|uniref:Uncharacterized protein n=1 Tax=Trichonephila clavata TaxID=2740835 RepID=A0A8X6L655_TRICU|nr:hypothetical protein TNCT_94511 [Trichonephila clavata]
MDDVRKVVVTVTMDGLDTDVTCARVTHTVSNMVSVTTEHVSAFRDEWVAIVHWMVVLRVAVTTANVLRTGVFGLADAMKDGVAMIAAYRRKRNAMMK